MEHPGGYLNASEHRQHGAAHGGEYQHYCGLCAAWHARTHADTAPPPPPPPAPAPAHTHTHTATRSSGQVCATHSLARRSPLGDRSSTVALMGLRPPARLALPAGGRCGSTRGRCTRGRTRGRLTGPHPAGSAHPQVERLHGDGDEADLRRRHGQLKHL